MILAAIDPPRETELRELLASMNDAPGQLKLNNAFSISGNSIKCTSPALLILEDKTTGDVRAYGLTPRTYPLYFALLGDVDGDARCLSARPGQPRARWTARAFFVLHRIYFATHLVPWMKQHAAPPIANYVNWHGRTVIRIREEAALREALVRHIDDHADAFRICRHDRSGQIAAVR